MNAFPIFPEVRVYYDKVEKETGFKIVVEQYPGLCSEQGYLMVQVCPYGDFAYLKNSKQILINIDPFCYNCPIQHQRGLAHELTHALLRHKYIYPVVIGANMELCAKINTFFEDIVVAKLIQTEGFHPYNNVFFDIMQKEIALFRRKHLPSHYSLSIARKNWQLILKISQTWGYLKYCKNTPSETAMFKEFIKVASHNFPEENKVAQQIIHLFTKNDIFTREGYTNVLRSIIRTNKLDIEIVQL